MASRRDLTKAQNRDTILAAARKVFAEMGFATATVRDVIRATPLASGTFYNYFKSKEEVYQALRDEVALAVRPRLRETRREAKTVEDFMAASFRGFFQASLASHADFAPNPPGAIRFRMDTPEVLAGIAELREDLELLMADGAMPVVDAGKLAAAMTGVAFELAQDVNTPDQADAAAAFATALMLGGIGALAKPV